MPAAGDQVLKYMMRYAEMSPFGHLYRCENLDHLPIATLHVWAGTGYLYSQLHVHRCVLPVWSLVRVGSYCSPRETEMCHGEGGGLHYNHRVWCIGWGVNITRRVTFTSRYWKGMSVALLFCLNTCPCLSLFWELVGLSWICGSKVSSVWF